MFSAGVDIVGRFSLVNLDRPVQLPRVWQVLGQHNFHSDLLARATAFALWSEQNGFGNEGQVILTLVGNGFVKPFNKKTYINRLLTNDPHLALKLQALDALESLSAEFGDRVSSVVWDTFAFMATRTDPTIEMSVLAVRDELPLPWWLVDSVLHSLGKVYGLMLHVHSRFFQFTGMVPDHNCDCNHMLYPPAANGCVSMFLPPDRIPMATAALFTHLLCETVLIAERKLPFALGITPEAQEVLSLGCN